MAQSRCVILGAGFSKSCGLPLARELTPAVWRSRARKDPTDTSPHPQPRAPGDFGYEQVSIEHETIKLLFPDRDCDPARDDSWPDFEQLITSLDEMSQYQRSFERISGTTWANTAEQAKSTLVRHLGMRLSERTDEAVRRGLEPVKRFLELLSPDSDRVISFNWDVLLEIAADDLRIPVHYHDGQGAGLCLAKPHGSLNLVDSSAAEYKDAKGAINVYGLDTELQYDDGEARIILRARNPRHAWIRHEWASERIQVEPNLRKRYDRRWLELQWARTLGMVLHADEIIVIGFSLPQADLRPRILLQLSRLNRAQLPDLTIVDPDATRLATHYKRLTGFEPVPFAGGLEDWLGRQT
jgi:hypothetical protein